MVAAFTAALFGVDGAGWRTVAGARSPVPGARGSVESLLHARRTVSGSTVLRAAEANTDRPVRPVFAMFVIWLVFLVGCLTWWSLNGFSDI